MEIFEFLAAVSRHLSDKRKTRKNGKTLKREKVPDFFIGFDNGVTGSFAVLDHRKICLFAKTPTRKCRDYQKQEAYLRRLDLVALYKLLHPLLVKNEGKTFVAAVERPLVNPRRFTATKSGLRFLEALLIFFETLDIPVLSVDSKEWQRTMLAPETTGEDLKSASLAFGKANLPPDFNWRGFTDADGLLIADWLRRKTLNLPFPKFKKIKL
jgi:hypothetical protein